MSPVRKATTRNVPLLQGFREKWYWSPIRKPFIHSTVHSTWYQLSLLNALFEQRTKTVINNVAVVATDHVPISDMSPLGNTEENVSPRILEAYIHDLSIGNS
ncbi:hypothetical protein M8J77_006845 [Diaphorina citri]|nr:hypothetical protein M8J77_006845 [Diaphorina citri]